MKREEFIRLTGEDPIDLFGNDWEQIIAKFEDEYDYQEYKNKLIND